MLYRAVRITSSERVADRFVTTQVIHAPDQTKEQLGDLFVVVEINRPWSMGARVGQAIVNTAQRLYYRTATGKSADRFEAMLKGINAALGRVAQNGETEWLGHLNAVIALVEDNELHFTSAGTILGFLQREGETTSVLEQPPDPLEEPHPLQTFGAITSGTLQEGDRVLFCNTMLGRVVGKEMPQLLKEESSQLVAAQVVRAAQVAKTKGVGGFVVSVGESATGHQPHVGVVYVDRPLESMPTLVRRYFKKQIIPGLQRGLATLTGQTKAIGDAVGKGIKKTAVPSLERVGETTESLMRSGWKKVARTPIGKTMTGLGKQSKEGAVVIRNYQEKIVGPRSRFGAFRIFGGASVAEGIAWFGKRRVWVIGVLGMIILISLTLTIRHSYKTARSGTQIPSVQEAQSLLQTAKSKLESGDQAVALGPLAQLAAIPTASAGALVPIITEAQQTYDKLTSSTRFSVWSPFATAPAGTDRLVTTDRYLLALESESGQITKFPLVGTGNVPIPFQGTSFIGAVNYTTQKVMVETKGNVLYSIDPTNDNVTTLKPDGGTTPTGTLVTTFHQYVYLVNPGLNELWRIPSKSDGGFGTPERVPTKGVSLKETIAMAADGFLYALNRDGTITKFSRSGAQDFSYKAIPLGLSVTDPIALVTDEALDRVYVVLKDDRIMQFDKTGRYLGQIVLPTTQPISAATLSSDKTSVWLLVEGNLYEVSLKARP